MGLYRLGRDGGPDVDRRRLYVVVAGLEVEGDGDARARKTGYLPDRPLWKVDVPGDRGIDKGRLFRGRGV